MIRNEKANRYPSFCLPNFSLPTPIEFSETALPRQGTKALLVCVSSVLMSKCSRAQFTKSIPSREKAISDASHLGYCFRCNREAVVHKLTTNTYGLERFRGRILLECIGRCIIIFGHGFGYQPRFAGFS